MPSTKVRLFRPETGWIQVPTGRCPLCNGSNADFYSQHLGNQTLFKGWCPACTNVYATSDALDEIRRQQKSHLLSVFLRRLPSNDWDLEVGIVAIDELDKLTSNVRETSILEQFDIALKFICEMCPQVGLPSQFNYEVDWPLLVAQSPSPALYILWELARAGYLQTDHNSAPVPPRPSWKAYARLQELQTSGRNSENAFVAMSFSVNRRAIWEEVIGPAIRVAGYRPVRVDQYEHNNRIDDEIIAQIRRSRFLVADFTEQKAGIYFEAGFALGLGRNVIWMCEESELGNLHFDTRQFNHILYKDAEREKARRALENRIVAGEGQGSYRPSDAA
jgi:nucleoside 2-deoxyribosyltransferase